MPTNATNRFLEQIYTSLTQELAFHSLNTHGMLTNTKPQSIDQIVEFEMKRIQENCKRKEVQYVEQMLMENPIAIGRRATMSRILRRQCDTLLSPKKKQQQQQQQRRWTEVFRRSRYNNKIKKAKSKYRHKYISQRLLQNTQLLSCIKDLIAQTEGHLLAQGWRKDKIHQMRYNYGMDGNSKDG